MKSKIKAITPNGTFESKHGLLYKFEYEMEDGTILTANHKTQGSPFEIGTEVEYEVKGTNDYGSWGSVKKPQDDSKPSSSYGGAKYTEEDIKRFEAKDISIKRLACVKAACSRYAGSSASKEDVVSLAKRLMEYVESGQ